MIIAFEGMDASGKGTQSKRLVTRLGDEKVNSIRSDFPRYNSYSGQPILMLLKREWQPARTRDGKLVPDEAMTAMAMQALQTVNRYAEIDLLRDWSSDYADDNGVLVLDRYYGSGLAYGAADGLDLSFLVTIHKALPQPDLWLFLDIDPDESIKRRPQRRDEYESRFGFMNKVRDQYLSLFKDPPKDCGGPWEVIDGSGTEDTVADRIWTKVKKFVLNRR
jgi:dTMP kinase